MSDFTLDDVALGIELPWVYDGTCVWLLKDGTIVNRFRQAPGWPAWRDAAVDEWIAEYGEKFRADNADLLEPCRHDSLSGDEGPVAQLGRMPEQWRCDECGAVVTDA